MRELIQGIIGVVITVAAVLFAVANRASVQVFWSPVNPPVALPLYALVLGGVVLGFFLGALLIWLDAGTLRAERRQQRRKISKLERALGQTELSDPLDHPM